MFVTLNIIRAVTVHYTRVEWRATLYLMLGVLEGPLTTVVNWIIGVMTDFFLFFVLLYFISSLNSSFTTSGVTQPRSQQRARSASCIRPRDSSHIGVSGTCEKDSLGKFAQSGNDREFCSGGDRFASRLGRRLWNRRFSWFCSVFARRLGHRLSFHVFYKSSTLSSKYRAMA